MFSESCTLVRRLSSDEGTQEQDGGEGGGPRRLISPTRRTQRGALRNNGLCRPCGTCSCLADATQGLRPRLTYAARSGLECRCFPLGLECWHYRDGPAGCHDQYQ